MTTQPSYVLMPAVAPTDEMIEAGSEAWSEAMHNDEFTRDAALVEVIYAAMVAARPHPTGELSRQIEKIVGDEAVRQIATWTHALGQGNDYATASCIAARSTSRIIALLNAGAPPVGEGKQGVSSSVADSGCDASKRRIGQSQPF